MADIGITISLDLVDGGNGVTGTGHRLVSKTETVTFNTDPTDDITASAFPFPISPGLYSSLYPHAEFLGLTPIIAATEMMNVIGDNVTLTAVDGTGSFANRPTRSARHSAHRSPCPTTSARRTGYSAPSTRLWIVYT